jgi:hypothetical protein
MEVDTDRQGADAHLDNDPLMQAALANDETGVDSSTPAANGAEAYSQDAQFARAKSSSRRPQRLVPQPQVFTSSSLRASELSVSARQKAEREAEELRRWRQSRNARSKHLIFTRACQGGAA